MDDKAERIRRYRYRAAQLRTMADDWADADARARVLDMAEDFDRMAEALEAGAEVLQKKLTKAGTAAF